MSITDNQVLHHIAGDLVLQAALLELVRRGSERQQDDAKRMKIRHAEIKLHEARQLLGQALELP